MRLHQSYWRLDWVSGKVSVYKTWEMMSSLFIGLLSKVIMTMRTWAVWNRNRTLTYVLPIFFIFVWGGSMVTVGIFLRTVRCQHSFFKKSWPPITLLIALFFSLAVDPSPLTPYAGCHLTRSDPIIFVSWVLLLLYDTGAIVIIYHTRQSAMCWNLNCV